MHSAVPILRSHRHRHPNDTSCVANNAPLYPSHRIHRTYLWIRELRRGAGGSGKIGMRSGRSDRRPQCTSSQGLGGAYGSSLHEALMLTGSSTRMIRVVLVPHRGWFAPAVPYRWPCSGLGPRTPLHNALVLGSRPQPRRKMRVYSLLRCRCVSQYASCRCYRLTNSLQVYG